MKSSTLLSFVALVVPTQCVKIRGTEFTVLVSSRPALILFTADGCKECDRVQEVLDRVSPTLTKTAIASVNCNEEPAVCDDSQVFTVPTLKFTPGNKELITYKEALDASSVVKYIERQSGSPVTELTEKNHLHFARSSRVTVVAFIGSDHQPELETFHAVATKWRAHYSFGNLHSPEKDRNGPSVAVYTQEEEDPIYYRGPFTVVAVEAFLQDATQPLIREYDPIIHEEATKDEKPLAQIFFSKRDDRAEIVKSLASLAKKYKDQLTFLTVFAPDYPKRFGSTFDDLAYDKSKDVLVEFYVPWCQYCTDLHTPMNELGFKYTKFGLSDKVALASIDVDANDVPIEIASYPSIRLYRAGSNDVVPFQGNFTSMLTVEQLDAFVSQSGSHGVSVISQSKAHDEL
ncbi:hypothetical protein CLIM01_12117 [Colletotrichum limetticola]|uniref:Protein disulfide-isomerase n=1 Tax=Colletotrichum limetticola TaxID=1209924 RepID=A0ABQ9PEP8_9PEZI|nr:hypothetical protein CLIM01_12117 [Colletotrichum limetticola]